MPKKKKQRQVEADARKAARNTLTAAQQLRVLDQRFGRGVGAKKERAKLATRMQLANQSRED